MLTSAKTIAIIGKYNAIGMGESLNELASFLNQSGHAVIFDTESAQNFELHAHPHMSIADIGRNADLAIVERQSHEISPLIVDRGFRRDDNALELSHVSYFVLRISDFKTLKA